ncbi:hypothetical protein [Acidithiobacillus ferriphilus]|uniref:hypothetical protein n=1 Tax=Acidithiobacillus ferriphilus TaxID=1689834 RepID=UPI002DBBBFBF|nr:hypothetical protein [Acidithiobacillus ferriphilus]MEB8474559.1 hypothetical protein [Acidithiobacillus ferriphilus]
MISAKKAALLVSILTLAAGCATTHPGLTKQQEQAALKNASVVVNVPASTACNGIYAGANNAYRGVSHSIQANPMGDGCDIAVQVTGANLGPISGITSIQVLPDGLNTAKITSFPISTPQIRDTLRQWALGRSSNLEESFSFRDEGANKVASENNP